MEMAGIEIEEAEKELMEAPKYPLTMDEYKKTLKEGKLLGLRCGACGEVTCPPMMVCQRCGSKELEKIEMSGKGELMTLTVINVPPEGFEGPYIVCLVKTAEGPWIPARLDYDISKLTSEVLGKTVELKEGMTLPGDKYSAGERVVPVFKVVE